MKNKKLDIRPFTKQFYKGNIVYFIFALCETLLGAIGALLVSWLIQQLIDLIGGYETGLVRYLLASQKEKRQRLWLKKSQTPLMPMSEKKAKPNTRSLSIVSQ